ncbi:hypothetical protein [Sulfuriroseicoccus oceanibius]|uniref:SLA1 homology domain-containing protein n=1 Tax=Sulfuriroseicoccus oceanibius TaxID=2707525 RepID=A0A6B3LCC3_9BACT|nr:hypothetical protein [Sulfuriroseicoccus oceanibius]QQL45549.1 hypothetical protein G3M56_002875 [Sulfuriroseicoccus oceanibius]
MKNVLICLAAAGLVTVDVGSARTFTDNQNRKIDAEIVRVDGAAVVFDHKGREVKFPIAKLSEVDQEYVQYWVETHQDGQGGVVESDAGKSGGIGASAGGLTLCGKVLKANGSVQTVTAPLDEKTLKEFSRSKTKPTELKISIALPKGFDPTKPQRVMWVSAPINNENERKKGNAGAMWAFAGPGTAEGWVVVAADTDMGNPRVEDNERSKGTDLAVHTAAVEALTEAWPQFKTWQFACCGGSGGGKASFYRVGDLLVNDLNVTGMFLAGCNQDCTADARAETRFKKSGLRKIKVWISNGRSDTISNVGHAESVAASMKGNRYGEIRLELFDGGHVIKKEEFVKALQWFVEEA